MQSDSSNYNFREVLIALEIHGIRLFFLKNPDTYAVFRLLGPPILIELNSFVATIVITKAEQNFCFYLRNYF